jgi:P-type Mg2+ transporter
LRAIDLYSSDLKDVLTSLGAQPSGLSDTEVEARRARYGINQLPDPEVRTWPRILFAQVKNPLILILVAASIISFFLGERLEVYVILAIVIVNTGLGFYQEYRSEQAVREIRRYVTHHVRVMRDATLVPADARELVPGDVVALGIGDIVPADLRLLEAEGLTVDESTLTGESMPVEKDPLAAVPSEHYGVSDLSNCALMGTTVESGNAVGLVVTTGLETEFARTAQLLSAKIPPTEFERGIRSFGRLLLVIIIIMTVFVFVANALLHHGVILSLLFALALAVGITPEAMPIIITISLSRGALKMAREDVVVKRLAAIENLGNVDVLCSDKTGTLTQNEVSVKESLDADGEPDDSVLELGCICNSALVNRGKVEGNNVDAAILRHFLESETGVPSWNKLETVEFDFKRRRMSVVVERDGRRLLVCKGAPESILGVCTALPEGKSLDEGERERIHALIHAMANLGLRSVAVAQRDVEEKDDYDVNDERDLVFRGLITLEDPPKSDTDEALALLRGLEVDFKLLTGDDPAVAMSVCRSVGFEVPPERLICGHELEGADPRRMAELVEGHDVFARVNPEQKFSIITSLRESGRVVGYLGDGVNDAPSLRAADVGISVDTALDVAKGAADIILLEPGLEVIATGIRAGREVFMNITKYLLNTMSANYGNMVTVALASLFLKFIPLLPAQILLNNFLTDIPMVTISTDNVDEAMLRRPRRWDLKLLTRFMIIFGVMSTIFDFITIAILIYVLRASPELFRTGWFLESAFSEILVTFAIRTAMPFWRSRPSSILFWTSMGALVVGLLLVFTPLGRPFQFVAMPFWFFLAVLGIIAAYFTMAELTKRVVYPRIGLID